MPFMIVDIVTNDDLQAFKLQLIKDIKELSALGSVEKKSTPWLRSREVRRLLNISAGTLQNLRISGKLRSYKVGSLHYYKQEDIENLLNNEV
jgi:Helix-turn-helix domain